MQIATSNRRYPIETDRRRIVLEIEIKKADAQ